MAAMELSWDAARAEALLLAQRELPLPDQVKRLLAKGASPINCIKALREIHGLDMAASKDLVDGALDLKSRRATEAMRAQLAAAIETWAEADVIVVEAPPEPN